MCECLLLHLNHLLDIYHLIESITIGVLSAMSDHKPKEIFAEDVYELQHLMLLYLTDEKVIDTTHARNVEKSSNRLNYIRDYVDAYIYTRAVWRLKKDLTYDSYIKIAQDEYRKNELPGMVNNSDGLTRVFEMIGRDIDKIIPSAIEDNTWKVWTCKLIATSLVLRNEGDYRINVFIQSAKYDTSHEFYNKLTDRELCHYD